MFAVILIVMFFLVGMGLNLWALGEALDQATSLYGKGPNVPLAKAEMAFGWLLLSLGGGWSGWLLRSGKAHQPANVATK